MFTVLNKVRQKVRTRVLNYVRSTIATIAVSFAIMAPVLVGASGLAVDYAQAYLVQQRLASALDAAALAGAASSYDKTVIENKIKAFFEANYPPDKVGFAVDPTVSIDGDVVNVTGKAYYTTYLMRLLGINELAVEAETSVNREVRAIEVVLVLDNTGSMSTNNNIKKLKEAARNFVNIIFDAAGNDQLVKIGIVPYANAVRVGSYGLGKNPDGTKYGDGSKFVNLPSTMSSTTNHNHTNKNQWFGCVLEHNPDGFDSSSRENDPYPNDVLDNYEGPWEIYKYQQASKVNKASKADICYSGKCYKYSDYYYPANSCPYAQIVPLTSDRDKLLEAIGDPNYSNDGMRAHGYTLGNIGLAWGGRLISPEKPFVEGSDWDNPYWNKVIIMMTDGQNTRESNYSAFWRRHNHKLGTTQFNNRMEETCDDLKEKEIRLYTITFTGGTNSTTREYYKRCATTEDKYHHTDDSDELVQVFEDIARELSMLHITQ